ncbi:MAG TPA: CsbD family protein [Caulobacteraceae bacterium]|jgi:uncharacterized protein YjbJ (UPF0337 family)|nr:CsbD family protein [Caulobacteraceae bacterium]
MSRDTVEGKLKNGAGRLQSAAGAALDDPEMQLAGDVTQAQGRVQEVVGVAKDALVKSALEARDFVTDTAHQATDAVSDIRDSARGVIDTVNPFVRDKPYAALALAALVGLIAGALLFGGGAKVIYIKPARP